MTAPVPYLDGHCTHGDHYRGAIRLMPTISPPTLIVGVPRDRCVPCVDELIEQFAHLEPWERRFWAHRERQRMLARQPIADTVRRAVYARDDHKCVACGTTERLSLDHIIPWSLCGPDTIDNLQTLCRSCNSKKGVAV